MQKHHYFGSTCFNWATGETRQEVVTKLAKMAGTDQIKRSVKGSGGLYCWTCKVDVPQGTDYQISFFQPQGVPVTDGQNHNIVNVKGHVTLIEPKEVA